MRARLIVVGNFALDYATEAHIARDAEAIGCDVVRWEERQVQPYPESFLAERPNLVVYMKSYGLERPDSWPAVWRASEAAGVHTASVHLDLYYGLPRQSEIGVDPFWHTERVFTADGDPNAAAYMAERGVHHVWSPAAIVSDESYIATNVRDGWPEIVFVGKTDGYHDAWPWRPTLVEGLRKRYGPRFQVFTHGSGMRGDALNRLYSKPGRIVVGDTLALPGHTHYWSDRYYETIGRGGFLIAPWVPGLEAHFVDGTHLRMYHHFDLADVFSLVDRALDEPDTCRTIAEAGQAHVAAKHTYQQRVERILREFDL